MNCIIFDLDGTLIDSVKDLAAAVNLTRTGHGLAPLPLADITVFVGEGPRKLLERSFHDVPDSDIDALLPEYKQNYGEHLTDHTVLYPGVKEGLQRLANAGIPLGIVTNKHDEAISTLLNHFGITQYFQMIIGSGAGFPHKPAPDALLHIAGELKADPASSWMVGDHFTDLEAGRRAGMKRALANWGFGNPRDEGWDFKAENFSAFVDYICQSLPPE